MPGIEFNPLREAIGGRSSKVILFEPPERFLDVTEEEVGRMPEAGESLRMGFKAIVHSINEDGRISLRIKEFESNGSEKKEETGKQAKPPIVRLETAPAP